MVNFLNSNKRNFKTYILNDSCLYHYVASHITSPYQPISQVPIVQNSSKTGLYATNLALLPNSVDNYFYMVGDQLLLIFIFRQNIRSTGNWTP